MVTTTKINGKRDRFIYILTFKFFFFFKTLLRFKKRYACRVDLKTMYFNVKMMLSVAVQKQREVRNFNIIFHVLILLYCLKICIYK